MCTEKDECCTENKFTKLIQTNMPLHIHTHAHAHRERQCECQPENVDDIVRRRETIHAKLFGSSFIFLSPPPLLCSSYFFICYLVWYSWSNTLIAKVKRGKEMAKTVDVSMVIQVWEVEINFTVISLYNYAIEAWKEREKEKRKNETERKCRCNFSGWQ